jgi:hypothetical protein
MSDDDELYGVWGGTPPGGWCYMGGGTMRGTKDEAEECAHILRKDYPDCNYDAVLFDPLREPISVIDVKPTDAQRKLLKIIDQYGTINTREFISLRNHSASLDVCHRNGWYMNTEWDKHRSMRLTAAGRSVLERKS